MPPCAICSCRASSVRSKTSVDLVISSASLEGRRKRASRSEGVRGREGSRSCVRVLLNARSTSVRDWRTAASSVEWGRLGDNWLNDESIEQNKLNFISLVYIPQYPLKFVYSHCFRIKIKQGKHQCKSYWSCHK